MMLMLLAVVLSGVVASKLLLMLGLGAMRIRYALAVIAAYLVFIGLVGLWLMYVRRVMFVASRTSSQRVSSSSILSGFDFGSSSGSGSGVDVPRFSSGGGSFGGGGASGSFTDADVVSPSNVTASSLSGSSSGSGSGSSWGGFDIDLDDGIWIAIAFMSFVAVLAVAGGWVIYDAPHMFSEAAFQFFLASGLLRGTRALKAAGWAAVATGGWKGIVVRRTVIPFLIVAIAAAVFGHIAQNLCPEARSIVEAYRGCAGKG
jgi:hypothetical protein